MSIDINKLEASIFKHHLNSKFLVKISEEQIVDMELVEVNDLTKYDNQSGIETMQERFSLLFHGPKDKVFDQSVYEIMHETIGNLSLFMVPVGQTDTATQYEVIVNRLLKRSTN